MSGFLEVRFSDEQLDAIAERVAAKLSEKTQESTRPLRPAEAANELNVSVSTIQRWVRAGLMKSIPNLTKLRIPRSEVDRFKSS